MGFIIFELRGLGNIVSFMPSENLKNLIYILEKILDFKHILPKEQDWVETYCGKVSTGRISGGDFDLVLKKIESENIANFETIMGNSVEGWGSDKLIITNIDWGKLEQYLAELKKEGNNISDKKDKIEGLELYAKNVNNNGKITSDSYTKVVSENVVNKGEISSYNQKQQKPLIIYNENIKGDKIIHTQRGQKNNATVHAKNSQRSDSVVKKIIVEIFIAIIAGIILYLLINKKIFNLF